MTNTALEAHYAKMWDNAYAEFSAGRFKIDPNLDNEQDKRYGLTLLARPTPDVAEALQKAVMSLKQYAPEQYYYPITDLHITILSVISCTEGFDLKSVNLQAYTQLIGKALAHTPQFSVVFRGITASPECILVQGYPIGDMVKDIRNRLREAFRDSALPHSIDKRYTLETAHMSFLRFRRPIGNEDAFLQALQRWRTHPFGISKIESFELVFNDWYQRKEKTKLLERFSL